VWKHGHMTVHRLTADALLAGPRGRTLCVSLLDDRMISSDGRVQGAWADAFQATRAEDAQRCARRLSECVAIADLSAVPLGVSALATGRTYAENRPYRLPETLGELVGPVTGVVQLPLRLDWSERMEFHLDYPAERNVMYERVIREATQIGDLRSYLNGGILRQVWPQLFLPARVRRSWEERFPDLRLAA
jgi:hypothetical protein